MFGKLRLGYWLLIGLTALLVVVAAVIGTKPVASLFTIKAFSIRILIWVSPILIWYGLLAVEVARRRTFRPTAALLRMTTRHRWWLLRGLLLMALLQPAATAIMSIKTAIPQIVPYYADPYFVAADRMLFGTDPWRITHALFGPLATLVIDRIYVLWFMVMTASLAWLFFSKNQRFQIRGVLAFYLSWILLGNALAILWASVGPCYYAEFYGNNHFMVLMDTVSRHNEIYPVKALGTMALLVENQGTGMLGNGISAMPSMHVAIAFLTYLLCRDGLKVRWPSYCAAAYTTIIAIGSVHLGWHYAVDGLVSIFGVTLIWFVSGRFVDWLERRNGAPVARRVLVPDVALAAPSRQA